MFYSEVQTDSSKKEKKIRVVILSYERKNTTINLNSPKNATDKNGKLALNGQ